MVQVPFAVLAVPAALAVRAAPELAPDRHRPAVRPNLTLALLSAALTAALFLLVLLLVEGWRRSPATAAVTVSVVPVAALAARPLARLLRPPPEVEVAVGCFLIAGGLVGLAIPPSADLAWTIAPQALVGLGLGLTVDRLTSQAMEMRLPRVRHAGWTIGARHVGVVVGLAILTPVFTADLRDAAGAGPGGDHVAGARRSAAAGGQDRGRRGARPRAVAAAGPGPRPAPRLRDRWTSTPRSGPPRPQLERDLDAQLERAATRAFRDSFLIGAGLALLALLTVVAPRRRRTAMTDACAAWPACRRSRWSWWPACSGSSSPTAAGRSSRSSRPTRAPRATVTSQADGIDGLTERLVLLGIDGAACRLRRQPRGADAGARAARHPHRRRDRRPARRPAGRRTAG